MLSWLLLDGERLPQDVMEARVGAEAAAGKRFVGAAIRLGRLPEATIRTLGAAGDPAT